MKEVPAATGGARTSAHALVRRSSGFTLVELVTVIVLAAILAAVAVARLADRSGFDAAGFADQAAAMLRYAQKQAIAQNRDAANPVFVRFDGNSITLCLSAAWPCPTSSRVRAPMSIATDSTTCTDEHWYCLANPDGVSYGVSLGAVAANAPQFLAFDGLGRPYTGTAAAPLAAPMTLSVSAGSSHASVTVEPETGYVH